MKTFTIKLYDTDTNEESVMVVETEKTLKEFVKAYNKAREEWYEDNQDFDCLSAHIDMRLSQKGFNMYPIKIDMELDF